MVFLAEKASSIVLLAEEGGASDEVFSSARLNVAF